MQVAEELDIPLDFFHSPALGAGPEGSDHSAGGLGSLQALLELRLLRALHEMRDHRTRRMLIRLAEQIVKRQANPCGDAGLPAGARRIGSGAGGLSVAAQARTSPAE